MSDRTPRERQPIDPEAILAATGFLRETLELMNFEADVRVHSLGDDTVIELTGRDAQRIVGKRGDTLDALQLLANRVASKSMGGERAGLIVDAAGWREERERALTDRAQQLGQRAVTEGKVVVMEPLPPRERRVIHMALARFEGVTTESEGVGEERRVRIIPVTDRR